MTSVINGWTHLGSVIEEQAARYSDKTFLAWHAERYSYEEVNHLADQYRYGLEESGAATGDVVCIMMRNCPEYVFTMFALAKLAAIEAGINPDSVGSALVHQLELAQPKVIVLEESSARAVAQVADQLTTLETIVFKGAPDWEPPAELLRFRWVVLSDFHALTVSAPRPVVEVPLDAPCMLRGTSGTTGPSKMVEISHNYLLHLASEVVWHVGIREDDVLFTPYPLFHGQAPVCCIYPALLTGGTAAIVERFSASKFWSQIREVNATVFDYIGAALTILAKQPERPDDRDNTVRLAHGCPTPGNWRELEQRYGLKLAENYGSTEACLPAWDSLSEPHHDGSCGRVCEHHDVQIIGDFDRPLAPGEVGEIAVRPRDPFTQMTGYWRNPEASAVAMRNFWFHTGDLGYLDVDQRLHFSGRKKDVIRRRGQNISAFEIESVMERDPAILEAAAIGVPSDLTEEDVKLVVVPVAGIGLTTDEVLAIARRGLAKYMTPRYVEIVDALPKGPSGKVNKYVLRDNWRNENTFDDGLAHHGSPVRGAV
ncbi:AMP-binding protein [Nocardioides sp.]|uniref:AMP-binding protein n=1 Tax=Nocardioides sp. TaxID=35761 RepID=UPI003D09E674